MSEQTAFLWPKTSADVTVDGVILQAHDSGATVRSLDRVRKSQDKLPTVLDIGAHIGTFSIWCAVHRGTKWAFAVEPWHVNLRSLLHYARRNHVQEKVHPLALGVWGTDGNVLELERIEGASGQLSLGYRSDNPNVLHEAYVTTISIPTLIDITGRVDCMKMDCEGAEWNAFGPSTSLADAMAKVDRLDLELHDPEDKVYFRDDFVHPYFIGDHQKPSQRMVLLLQDFGFEVQRSGRYIWAQRPRKENA